MVFSERKDVLKQDYPDLNALDEELGNELSSELNEKTISGEEIDRQIDEVIDKMAGLEGVKKEDIERIRFQVGKNIQRPFDQEPISVPRMQRKYHETFSSLRRELVRLTDLRIAKNK